MLGKTQQTLSLRLSLPAGVGTLLLLAPTSDTAADGTSVTAAAGAATTAGSVIAFDSVTGTAML